MSRIREALRKAEAEAAALTGQSNLPAAALSALSQLAPEHTIENADGLPLVTSDVRHETWQPDPRRLILSNGKGPNLASEQYRTLRSRLYHLREQKAFKTLLISSAVPGEGKTFVAANLAYVLSRRENTRVALIDADLRWPRLHQLLGAPLRPGLTEFLRGAADYKSVLQAGSVPDLCFVAGGETLNAAAELLSNGRFAELLAQLTSSFDWVIIDSPALAPVSDGLLLAGMCDAALMIVQSGKTPADAARRAVQELQRKRLLGVVLNCVPETQLTNYYKGYYQKDCAAD